MKKCPFCNAEIEENSRFCLYCMSSLEEKTKVESLKENNKRWLFIIAAVLVFIIIILCVWLAASKKQPKSQDETSLDQVSSQIQNDTSSQQDAPLNSENAGASQNSVITKNSNTNSSNGNSTQGSTAENTTTNTLLDSDKTQNTTTSSGTTTQNSPTNTTTPNGDTTSSNDSPSSSDTSTPPATTTVSYSYRDAKYGDDFSVSTNLENSVVITGVLTATSDGEYIIPETIDGKRVIAIMGLAFCDNNIKDTVKKVVIPSSVKTIWNYAFANCYNLIDIYFCGNSIYTEAQAFPESSKRTGTLTIHCSATCSDRNFRYYKNSSSSYGAQYKEWNG